MLDSSIQFTPIQQFTKTDFLDVLFVCLNGIGVKNLERKRNGKDNCLCFRRDKEET